MRGYPLELRERVLRAAQERSGSIKGVAKLFMVGTTFIYKMLRQERETGTVAPKPHGGGFAPTLDEPELKLLRELVQEQPDATLEELRQRLRQRAGVEATLTMVCRALQKLGLPRKKKRFFAQERNKKKREAFRQEVQGLDPRKFVFIDEMGVNIDLSRRYARAPKGQRVEEPIPRNTPANLSMAGALGARKLLTSCCVEGAFDGEVFAAFIEQMVVPQLEPGQTVLMDNVPTHQSERVENAIKGAGAKLLNLPPYSPDFDPAESYWSKIKSILRGAKARTVAAVYQAIGSAMKQVTAEDIHGWYKHAGYDFAPG